MIKRNQMLFFNRKDNNLDCIISRPPENFLQVHIYRMSDSLHNRPTTLQKVRICSSFPRYFAFVISRYCPIRISCSMSSPVPQP